MLEKLNESGMSVSGRVHIRETVVIFAIEALRDGPLGRALGIRRIACRRLTAPI
jgi:hypothetical protein